jgi:hypothetical protein
MKTSEQIIEISKAMNLAQREMRPAIKDSTNPHFRSKYSDLASVMEAIREPIGNNGLSIWQDATLEESGVSVTTRIVHVSGQWVEFGPLTIPLGKKDAHAVGSACSYGKRYALCAALGVVSDDDDDGNKAVASYKNESKKMEVKQSQQQPLNQFVNIDEMIDNTPKTINESQWTELKKLVNQCTSRFQTNFWEGLKSWEIFSDEDFSKIKEEDYLKMKSAAVQNIEKKKKG